MERARPARVFQWPRREFSRRGEQASARDQERATTPHRDYLCRFVRHLVKHIWEWRWDAYDGSVSHWDTCTKCAYCNSKHGANRTRRNELSIRLCHASYGYGYPCLKSGVWCVMFFFSIHLDAIYKPLRWPGARAGFLILRSIQSENQKSCQ